jgi:hypothetical protein
MTATKRTVEGRDYWFLVEPACSENPDTGALTPIDRFSCSFSDRKPGPTVHGEFLKDENGLAKLFPTPETALEAGVREVQARLHLPGRAFAVGLPRGMTQAEDNAYVDLLRQQGLVPGKPKIEDSFGRHWHQVWESREEAEQFAAQVRQATNSQDWEVYDLSPPRHSADGNGRGGPVEILVGRRSDGRTYGLHPNSLALIRQRVPEAHARSAVFIGGNGQRGPLYDQVGNLLTGLTPSQVKELGGYRIVDPLTDLVLYSSIS